MHTLERFLQAQEGVYEMALGEIRAGLKQRHWIWFIFPQLRGLGYSPMAVTYGLQDLAEAKSYLAHPVLSQRLIEITEALLAHKNKPIEAILGELDAKKLCSCMTLFSQLSPEGSVFHQALAAFYKGRPDRHTLVLLKQ